VKGDGFLALGIGPVDFEMGAMWVLGYVFDVVDWLSFGYGRVVAGIGVNVKIWLDERHRCLYVLGGGGCHHVFYSLSMHVAGHI